MSLLQDLEGLRSAALAAFDAAKDQAALESARVEYLGTRGKLKSALGRMNEVAKEEKPAVGKRANELSSELHFAFEAAKTRMDIAAPAHAQGQGQNEGTSLEQLRRERLDKLARYNDKAGPGAAWGSRFPDRTSGKSISPIEEVRKLFPAFNAAEHAAGDSGKKFGTAVLAARVMLRRDQSKKLIFLTVQDQSGTIQVALWNSLLNEETLALLRDTLDLWDIVGVEGELFYTQKGEPTLWATSARILSKCIAPPPDKHHGIHDKELRYRHRYLDLIASPESRHAFILRSKLVAGVRRFLDAQGFLEVETPVLQTIPGGAAARPFETKLNALDMRMYMRIATEIGLKKVLVGGLERVYELGRIFRNEGVSQKHNPEFTMIEIYQAYADLRDMMALMENLVSHLTQTLTGSTTVTFRGKPVKLGAPWPRLPYCDLLKQHSGVSHDDIPGLERKLREKNIDPTGLSYVDKIDGVFGEYAEPHLQDACFVINQPVEMSPLCKAHPQNAKLADRFEAFASGMEMGNAYSELNDPVEQRKRLVDQAHDSAANAFAALKAAGMLDFVKIDPADGEWVDKAKKAIEAIPDSDKRKAKLLELARNTHSSDQHVDEDFLFAMEHGMPPAGGLGIGIDRIAMLIAGVDSIRDVILFPLMRPE